VQVHRALADRLDDRGRVDHQACSAAQLGHIQPAYRTRVPGGTWRSSAESPTTWPSPAASSIPCDAIPRIVAGIAETYAPDQVVGKQVIVVANLEPATIRGIPSQGMLLAAGDGQVVGLSALDRNVPPGTRVR